MYISQNIVVEALKDHKGRFLSLLVDKKLKKNQTEPEEGRYNTKICSENTPTFKDHSHLVSIKLSSGRYASFDTRRVKSMKISKMELTAV